MSRVELQEWKDYYQREPFSSDRNELQLAQLSAMASSFMGGKLETADFMPSYKREEEEKEIISLKGNDLESFIFANF